MTTIKGNIEIIDISWIYIRLFRADQTCSESVYLSLYVTCLFFFVYFTFFIIFIYLVFFCVLPIHFFITIFLSMSVINPLFYGGCQLLSLFCIFYNFFCLFFSVFCCEYVLSTFSPLLHFYFLYFQLYGFVFKSFFSFFFHFWMKNQIILMTELP